MVGCHRQFEAFLFDGGRIFIYCDCNEVSWLNINIWSHDSFFESVWSKEYSGHVLLVHREIKSTVGMKDLV